MNFCTTLRSLSAPIYVSNNDKCLINFDLDLWSSHTFSKAVLHLSCHLDSSAEITKNGSVNASSELCPLIPPNLGKSSVCNKKIFKKYAFSFLQNQLSLSSVCKDMPFNFFRIMLSSALTISDQMLWGCILAFLQNLKAYDTCFENEYNLNCQEKSKVCRFISKRRMTSLVHSSILRQIWLNCKTLCLVFIWRLFQFSHFCSRISNFFRPEHHWRDLSSRNVHLVHQNC
jgi:hypothetical protein